MEACDVCGGLEKRTAKKLVSVCDCYKKYEDCGRMHEACLQQYLQDLSARDEDSTKHYCPRCHEPYRVRISRRFVCDWQHFCTARSLNNVFELVVVCLTLVCCVSCFLLLDFKKLEKEHVSKWLLYGMGLVSVLMVGFTLHKVFGRWRKANSDVFVSAV